MPTHFLFIFLHLFQIEFLNLDENKRFYSVLAHEIFITSVCNISIRSKNLTPVTAYARLGVLRT